MYTGFRWKSLPVLGAVTAINPIADVKASEIEDIKSVYGDRDQLTPKLQGASAEDYFVCRDSAFIRRKSDIAEVWQVSKFP